MIVEPTYGAGNFVLAALKAFPLARLVYGVEIQEKYEWQLKMSLLLEALDGRRPSAEVELHWDDIFTHAFPTRILTAQNILIIGNPPWVTSAELSTLNSHNLPVKRNLKALKGMDAVTGKSNFDISEFVLLRLLSLFSGQRGTLAMLCKNSIVKNMIEALPQQQFQVSNLRAIEIDAYREFGVSVEASLLVMDLGVADPTFTCGVATLDQPDRIVRRFGWAGNRFVSNIDAYALSSELDGTSPLLWRQGLKHDSAKVMELDLREGQCFNGKGESVEVEAHWVFPLLKSSDLRNFEVDRARKKVIITQRRLGEDTTGLQARAPKLWKYLIGNREYFERRKSSIYRNKPLFSIFGIGEYSFKNYKVAISGLYKLPCFSILLPIAHQPVMLDDTCYFLGFDTYLDALLTASLLNSPIVAQFLQSIVFPDAKRPYTKEVLMRIDLAGAAAQLSFGQIRTLWSDMNYEPRTPVTELDFEDYKHRVLNRDTQGEGFQYKLGV